ncbi:unnamed protein product [Didymodactylos carnosus]|uniref:Aminotransferase class I/classII large domain-containing protein n=1 Tax=Didymodactylos carnosus TaxID=1234261 RepID=A0A815Q5V4_9BILA|nr:unnamed protein product [Didymodactylos carnosus]CAF1458971.1 unnamed protein product [Didymodactylos carnosus]CAF4090817.1 unnamed protein product [Didymodactylos carnosus]CAF4329895.1 unnamed protein product [Didymodactylos carnosus]
MTSKRSKILDENVLSICPYFKRFCANPFDETKNPNGILNLGVAENMLCEDMIAGKLASIQNWFPEYNYYPDAGGELAFRKELCQFFTRFFLLHNTIQLEPKRLLITSGATTGFALYSFVLADINDVFIVASPYYSVMDRDISLLTHNTVIRCPLLDQDKGLFRIHVDIYRRGYNEAIKNGLTPKCIIITNPQNPQGSFYDEETLMPILEFAAEKQIHVIVDEIYALSIFKTSKQPFTSILNYQHLPDPKRTHFLWSFSKDFGLSGARLGVLYFGTEEICRKAQKLNYLFLPSRAIQMTLINLISDHEWVEVYIETNQRRLTEQYFYVINQLKLISNNRIQVYKSNAGFFIWANFQSYMKEKTFDEELRLYNAIFNGGVFISRGKNMGAAEPGWFRLVFSVKDNWINEALGRIQVALERYEENCEGRGTKRFRRHYSLIDHIPT